MVYCPISISVYIVIYFSSLFSANLNGEISTIPLTEVTVTDYTCIEEYWTLPVEEKLLSILTAVVHLSRIFVNLIKKVRSILFLSAN